MLKSLYVRDFALIDELSVSFASGLTIITGETGAGKSILMGALNMVLGERASAELVRAGARKAVIEAVFGGEHYEMIGEMIDEEEIERTPELILRRDISATGQSRCFINDTPCTVSLLKRASQQLVDLHGQHDHQLLLHAETHAGMLDGFGLLHTETAQYRTTLDEYRSLRRELQTLNERADALREKRDFIDYQFKELDAAALVEGEMASIDEEINLLENAETLFSLGTELGQNLYESDSSAYTALSSAVHLLEKLAGIDKSFEPWLDELRGATATVEELNRFAGSYAGGIDFNPDRLEELRERQMLLQRLAKKHGKSIDELINLRDSLAEELSLEENLAGELAAIEAEIGKARTALSASASTLSEHRREAAGRLEEEIMQGLSTLGIPHSTFEVRFTREAAPDGDIEIDGTRYRAFDNGCDHIEFMISTNLGESPKPLAKVASGGEISRVMLAMKSALARSAELPILVFDEIDTGISGKVAQSVGFSLKRLSRMHQIMAITHLPQIAAMGDLHLAVQKRIEADRTLTGVAPLTEDEHVREVARLFSGADITETSLQLAEELIETGKTA